LIFKLACLYFCLQLTIDIKSG